jgi:hypothetical protein
MAAENSSVTELQKSIAHFCDDAMERISHRRREVGPDNKTIRFVSQQAKRGVG